MICSRATGRVGVRSKFEGKGGKLENRSKTGREGERVKSRCGHVKTYIVRRGGVVFRGNCWRKGWPPWPIASNNGGGGGQINSFGGPQEGSRGIGSQGREYRSAPRGGPRPGKNALTGAECKVGFDRGSEQPEERMARAIDWEKAPI